MMSLLYYGMWASICMVLLSVCIYLDQGYISVGDVIIIIVFSVIPYANTGIAIISGVGTIVMTCDKYSNIRVIGRKK